MRKFLLSLLVWAALAGSAFAQPVGMPPTVQAVAAPTYVGPGDIVSSAFGWWGLRGYNGAYSGNVADICDSATGVVCATITWNGLALVIPTIGGVACNNSTNICVIATLYDQSGNGHNMVNATNATRPTLKLSCIGSLPCMAFAASATLASSASTISGQPVTMSSVYESPAGAPAEILNSNSAGITIGPGGSFNVLTMAAGTVANVTASDGAFHAAQVIFNNPASIGYVDGTSTGSLITGTAGLTSTGYTVNSGTSFGAGAINIAEMGAWPSGFSAGNQSSMNSNQRNYWRL